MNILLAEDDKQLVKILTFLLKKEGWSVDAVGDGQEALAYAQLRDYDIVLLDWMMPKLTGPEVCRRLRSERKGCGIILLTARDTTEDKICGLDCGADDYLVKPFEFPELAARLRALFRRRERTYGGELLRHACGLALDLRSLAAFDRQKRDLGLTRREFQLLQMLLEHAGQVLPREMIIEHIWNGETGVTSNALDSLVKLLRRKLAEAQIEPIVRTVHGIGYKVER